MGAEGILYHARMRVLKSRQGSRQARSSSAYARHLPSVSNRKGGNLPASLTAPQKPCPPEKLLPPAELLTRERAFRYTYLQHHQPTKIQKLSSLSKPEDPARDAILARIRAAERAKREKEMRAVAAEKERQAKATREAQKSSKLPRVGNKGDFDSDSGRENIMERQGQMDIESGLPKSAASVAYRPSHWYEEDMSSEEEFGEFAFLSQWSSKEVKQKQKNNKLPSLR